MSIKSRLRALAFAMALCAICNADTLVITGDGWTDPSIPRVHMPLAVSIIQIIVNSKDYDGRRIAVQGFLSLRQDDFRVYMSSEFYRYGQAEYAVRLGIDRSGEQASRFLEGKYVYIEGTFHAVTDLDGSVGEIDSVRRVVRLAVP